MESIRYTTNYNYTKVNDAMGYPKWVKEITFHFKPIMNIIYKLKYNMKYIYTMKWTTQWLYNYIQRIKNTISPINNDASNYVNIHNERDNLELKMLGKFKILKK